MDVLEMKLKEPVGYTIRIDGKIEYEFFLPTEDGAHQAAKDAGYSSSEYEVVGLAELI